MRRNVTPAERQLSALVQRMNAGGRTFGIAQDIRTLYKGSPRYRYCLYEIVEGVSYKRTAWYSSRADLLAHLRTRTEKHTTSTQGAA